MSGTRRGFWRDAVRSFHPEIRNAWRTASSVRCHRAGRRRTTSTVTVWSAISASNAWWRKPNASCVSASMPRSVTHVITGLGTGGAETMLVNLLAATDRTRWSPAVVSLHDRGTLGDEIERLGVPVNTVGLGLGWPNPVAWWRVSREVKRQSPELVLGWMYHGNLAALAARALLGRRLPILWGIQYTPDELGLEKARTALMIRLGARLSSWVTRIVYNSHVSARRH